MELRGCSLETSSLSSAGAFPDGIAAGPGPEQLLMQTTCHIQLVRWALIYIMLKTFSYICFSGIFCSEMTVLPATGWNELIWATDSLAAKRKDWHGIGVLFPALGVGFGVLLCFLLV